MKYYFIAVNYNGFEHSKNFINNVILFKAEYDIRVIIVDNNSRSEDLSNLETYIKGIDCIELVSIKENLGYFGGLNEGLKRVERSDDVTVIIGNNDITFDADFIKAYEMMSIHDSVFVIAPYVITKDGQLQNPLVIEKVGRIEKFKNRIYFSNYYIGQLIKFLYRCMFRRTHKPKLNNLDVHRIMKIKRGIGAVYVLTPNFLKSIKLLDDRVFLWGEEVLFSKQVEESGGEIFYNPNMKVEHHESATVSLIDDRKKYEMVKRSYSIYRKHL